VLRRDSHVDTNQSALFCSLGLAIDSEEQFLLRGRNEQRVERQSEKGEAERLRSLLRVGIGQSGEGERRCHNTDADRELRILSSTSHSSRLSFCPCLSPLAPSSAFSILSPPSLCTFAFLSLYLSLCTFSSPLSLFSPATPHDLPRSLPIRR
jgi:hypothetical protein